MERALATSFSTSVSIEEMTPRMTPRSRRCRTRARVSISASTGILNFSRYSSATCCERQLELTRENSRTINPSIRPGSLVVFRIGAVIPDFRIGQDNDLAGVRRVGENFLVAGDGSIENNFAVALCFCSVTFAAEDSAIFQRKDGLHSRSGEWIL